MLEITNDAVQRLRRSLAESGKGTNDCFRILIRENCLEVIGDEERPGDVTIEHGGEVLVVMDQATADCLSGRKIEYDENISRLVFT